MTTAYRTPIRRRLAIRGRPRRPPARARKGGHGSILAPLAATVAATVLVAVVLFLTDRDRRAALPRPGGDRRFELLPGEPTGNGLRRIALGQLDEAIELLEGTAESAGAGRRVHDTRKALKRLRALLRLLRRELGESEFADEDRLLRGAGLALAGAREAEVMLATLDALLARHPRRPRRRTVAVALRRELMEERERTAASLLGDSPERREALGRLRDLRVRVAGWTLGDVSMASVEAALRLTYGDGRRRMRRVAAGRGNGLHERHQWRKRAKRLRYGAQLLGLTATARRADELAELLGEERDLALLRRRIKRVKPGSRDGRRKLIKLIDRRRRKLRKRALARGGRLYRRTPRKFIKHVRTRNVSRAS